jgi:hypothetical protein
MSQRRIVAMKKSELGRPESQKRISADQQCSMEPKEELAADVVVDVPQAGDDVGHTRREEWTTQAHRTFDARDRSGRRTTRTEDHHPRTGKTGAPQLVKVQGPGITGGRIAREEKTRGRGRIGAGGGMAGEVHDLTVASALQESGLRGGGSREQLGARVKRRDLDRLRFCSWKVRHPNPEAPIDLRISDDQRLR